MRKKQEPVETPIPAPDVRRGGLISDTRQQVYACDRCTRTGVVLDSNKVPAGWDHRHIMDNTSRLNYRDTAYGVYNPKGYSQRVLLCPSCLAQLSLFLRGDGVPEAHPDWPV